MLYHVYEMNHAAMMPWRMMAEAGLSFWKNDTNPMGQSSVARTATASLELFERLTRRYGKPQFGITTTEVGGKPVDVLQYTMLSKPFGNLVHFAKPDYHKEQPKLLVVAPMSGHYATLLRGTVEGLLPFFDVYITDWNDARSVPLVAGSFDLDDYIDYVRDFLHHIGERVNVVGVCQPSVPVLAAVSLMAEDNDARVPLSMTLMGGPIDTRCNPTVVNKLAEKHDVDWFRQNVTMSVPFPHLGAGRVVYPGFLQLTGFMQMNLDRHMNAHRDLFWHLVEGDGDSADKHREFYDEYMSVMDLTAEFYLQTVDRVFVHHDLPCGTFRYRGRTVDPACITTTGLLTIEGERDDISGVGQTQAAQRLCSKLPDTMKSHYLQPGVGHYGVFSGSRFRAEIVPRIAAFVASLQDAKSA
jgi:poly(3-hydroxybutyrate) depolymerase